MSEFHFLRQNRGRKCVSRERQDGFAHIVRIDKEGQM